MYKFLLIANCEQRLRYAYYFYPVDKAKRPSLEAALIKKCLSRNQNSCSFFLHDGFNIVYRRTGQLILIIGTDDDENNLAVYEFVRAFLQVLDAYFSGVTEKKVSLHQKKKKSRDMSAFSSLFTMRARCLDCRRHQIVAEFFKLHLVLQHMVSNGNVSETNVQNILERLKAFDNA
ncbi:AP-4 complex subunit sigma-1-like [Rhipicephalus microplus]|uniref:AP-4 complex subunit sigma-1-like n=1 Tax=Rhipicephalus microplus TaxID=6941 RepID=UPI003F6A6D00